MQVLAVTVLGVLAALQFASAVPSYYSNVQDYNGGDVSWCQRTEDRSDRLQYQTRLGHKGINFRDVVENASRPYVKFGFSGKVTLDIDLPMSDKGLPRSITCIKAENYGRTTGTARITRGGLGYNSVTLHFEADYTQEFDFMISIYG